jgi:hypothetical protein
MGIIKKLIRFNPFFLYGQETIGPFLGLGRVKRGH